MAVPEDVETLTCYRHPGEPTRVRCARCERPICTQCMEPSPVGMRCPECSGRTRTLRPRSLAPGQPTMTYALIGINIAAFVAERGGLGTSWAFQHGALTGEAVAAGDWWRVITATFLHANLLHIAFNMYALYILGTRLEGYVGTLRFGIIYFLGALGGSAGALLATNPRTATVGASGAVFALMGALLVLERRGVMLIGPVVPLLLFNLAFTFLVPGISIGGHVGGLLAGIVATLALEGFGRGHVAYGRLRAPAVLGIAAVLAGEIAIIIYAVSDIVTV